MSTLPGNQLQETTNKPATDREPLRKAIVPALPLSNAAGKENAPSTISAGPPGMKRPDITTVTQVAQEAQQKSLAQRIRPRGLSRTLSMPTIAKSSPYRSISEELQQLRDNSLPVYQDHATSSEEAELQRKLKESMACIDGKHSRALKHFNSSRVLEY